MKSFALVLGLVVALPVLPLPAWSAEEEAPSSPYTPRPPIRIRSNGEFTAENGVVQGSGTSHDPFVIRGWEIKAGRLDEGIYIRNVNAHYVIEGNKLYHDPPNETGMGIYLVNAGENGVIRFNHIHDNTLGIFVLDSLARIEGNVIESNFRAGSTVAGGVYLSARAPLLWDGIKNNTIRDNAPWGVYRSPNVLGPFDFWAPIDASGNYWGSPLGPTTALRVGTPLGPLHVPLGLPTENYVTPTVLAAPWLLEEP